MPDAQNIVSSDGRRRNQRPPLPKFGIMVRLDEMLMFAMENIKHHWTARIILLLLISVALGSVWWSYHYRLSLVEGSNIYMKRLYTLQRDVDNLTMHWSQTRMKQQKDELFSYDERVMPDLEVMNSWLQQQLHRMQAKGLQLAWHVQGQEPISHVLKDIRVLRVSLDIHQKSGVLDFNYLLSMLTVMTSDHWRVEVASLTMDGDGKGVDKVTINLRIWVKQSQYVDQLAHLEGK